MIDPTKNYFWKDNQVHIISTHTPLADIERWFIDCPCIDGYFVNEQDGEEGMYGTYFVDPEWGIKWRHIPLANLSSEFKAALMLSGVLG